MAWTQQRLTEVVEQNEVWLLSQAGVVGVGVGLDAAGQICVQVLTDGIKPEIRRSVEQRFQGVPLMFDNTGPIEAL